MTRLAFGQIAAEDSGTIGVTANHNAIFVECFVDEFRQPWATAAANAVRSDVYRLSGARLRTHFRWLARVWLKSGFPLEGQWIRTREPGRRWRRSGHADSTRST